ncbi:MAG: L-lactate dehydrogenase [Desulfovibrionales bacterium]
MKIDPVCGMKVNEARTEHTTIFRGQNFAFCTSHCKEAFEQDPLGYLEGESDVRTGRKVVIIGTGAVGSTYAYALMRSGLTSTIILVGRTPEKVRAQVMDLNHGLMFVPPVHIREGRYEDCKNADLVVVTAGVAQKEGDTRIDLARRNADLFRSMIPEIVRHGPKDLLIVTNPVDVLTYVAIKISGLPMNRVIGSGTVLDTARFRYLLSRHCGVDPRNVHGYILGEHGDTEVPIWSKVDIGGMPIRRYCLTCGGECPAEEMDAIFHQVKNAAYDIIKGKGATSFAIGLAMVRITEALLRDENSILTVSTLVDGYYDIRDVCLSIPAVLNRNGVAKTVKIELDDVEAEQLRHSAGLLRQAIEGIGF